MSYLSEKQARSDPEVNSILDREQQAKRNAEAEQNRFTQYANGYEAVVVKMKFAAVLGDENDPMKAVGKKYSKVLYNDETDASYPSDISSNVNYYECYVLPEWMAFPDPNTMKSDLDLYERTIRTLPVATYHKVMGISAGAMKVIPGHVVRVKPESGKNLLRGLVFTTQPIGYKEEFAQFDPDVVGKGLNTLMGWLGYGSAAAQGDTIYKNINNPNIKYLQYTPNKPAPKGALVEFDGSQSKMTREDAPDNFPKTQELFEKLVELIGFTPEIGDAIPKQGTSREKNTENSQHFHGKALDLYVSGLNKEQIIKMVKGASLAGFTAMGFASWGLHVDWRNFDGSTWQYYYKKSENQAEKNRVDNHKWQGTDYTLKDLMRYVRKGGEIHGSEKNRTGLLDGVTIP